MSYSPVRATSFALVTVFALASATAAGAQNSGFLDGLFGGGRERPAEDLGSTQMAQMSGADLVVRLERLENQIRQLTGAVEQLQHRNQQLEQQLRGGQGSVQDGGFQDRGASAQRAPARPQTAPALPPAPSLPASSGRRSDVYDPGENPNAPGAPRPLGSMVAAAPPMDEPDVSPVGAPGGRDRGAPLDLSTLAGAAASDPGLPPPVAGSGSLPPPPARNPNATGPMAALPPSASPRDEYDLGYGYVLRKDYALAEQTFRGFLGRYGNDARAPDAHYWLGESLFQRQRYREAAEAFLTVSTKYETAPKAPDSLLRLGQSLAALGEKETACAALGEIGRKYPRASVTVKQGVDREQKRVRC